MVPKMDQVARCNGCGYVLIGLPAGRCPECGRDFDPDNAATFTTRPPFIRWKYWLPGFLLATISGTLLWAVLILYAGWSWSITFIAPFCLGAVIGYGCRTRPFVLVLLALGAAGVVICGLFTLNIVGIFCGLMLAAVALGPVLAGTFAGFMLRLAIKASSFDQRWHLPTLAMLLIPALAGAIDRATSRPHAIEAVVTSVHFPTPVGRAWNSVMFYEEVRHSPPWLLRLGLPKPLRTMGTTEHVGDVKFCIYTKGRLAKQVTRREPQKLLAFDVIVQYRVENHSVRLTDGSFRFIAEAPDDTVVELTTRYEPKLGPRWVWRPAERLAVHTMHRHILEGMRRNSTER